MFQSLLFALIIGVTVGLLGGGGSILAVPIFHYGLGMSGKISIALSLGSVGLMSLFGMYMAARRNDVLWSRGLLFAAFSMTGAYMGASVGSIAPDKVQIILFAIVMFAAAFVMLHPFKVSEEVPAHSLRGSLLLAGSGISIGFLTGLVGVGGGFLVVPALVFFAGMPIKKAVGTSLLILALQALTGFGRYLQADPLSEMEWRTLYLFAGVGALGTFAGSLLNQKIKADKLKKYFGYFLVVISLFILAKEIFHVL